MARGRLRMARGRLRMARGRLRMARGRLRMARVRLRMARVLPSSHPWMAGEPDRKQEGGDVPLYIIMEARAASSRLSTDSLSRTSTDGPPGYRGPLWRNDRCRWTRPWKLHSCRASTRSSRRRDSFGAPLPTFVAAPVVEALLVVVEYVQPPLSYGVRGSQSEACTHRAICAEARGVPTGADLGQSC